MEKHATKYNYLLFIKENLATASDKIGNRKLITDNPIIEIKFCVLYEDNLYYKVANLYLMVRIEKMIIYIQ